MNLVFTRAWSMLLMPSCVLLACVALGTALVLAAWRRGKESGRTVAGQVLLLASLGSLYLASTPLVALWLAGVVEGGFAPVDPASLPAADAIVVPGGSMECSTGPDGHVHLFATHASDRFEAALAAFAAGRAPLIAFGGGHLPKDGVPPEGSWNRDRAVLRGVPADRVLAADAARHTSDEAEALAAALRGKAVRRVILATSAMHMRRAKGHFETQGLEVIPLPCDFATRGVDPSWSPALLVPRGKALALTDSCARELLGLAAARLLGW